MCDVHGAEVEAICGRGVHADINILTEPMMWTPRILSALASLSSLTRPSASAVVCVCVCVCVLGGRWEDGGMVVEGSGRGGRGERGVDTVPGQLCSHVLFFLSPLDGVTCHSFTHRWS